ncbi:MAG: hypothetical protein PHS49_06880 [Candidatus Gracilibacteria bacterium]|nr:hypothetical protein [Candidatus Gracilibacteria bacterium]
MNQKLNSHQKSIIRNYYLNQNELLKLNSSRLAQFLESKGFPTYRKGESCGANVGEALIDFGIDGLPNYGRDGYKWTEILDKNKYFRKVSISDPNNAYPGGILVYDRGFSNNKMRKTYGHVEIKTNEGFWSGGKQKYKAGLNIKDGFVAYVYYLK